VISLKPEQWERVWALEAQLGSLPDSKRSTALAEIWATEQEDSAVLRVLEQLLQIPPEPSSETAATEVTGGWRCGEFTLLEPIGQGGMGIVYLAEQRMPGNTRKVALKLARPERLGGSESARQFFEQEMRSLSALQHEGIARLYAGGVCPGPGGKQEMLYFAMELIDGIPLDQFAEEAPGLSVPDHLDLFVRLCRAIEYAHANRVIHCDLKPGNILVTRDSEGVPHPHVLDFGLSWVYGSEDLQPFGCGTLQYMSPEQMDWKRYGDLSVRTDVYAWA
jgi:serine/threonine protein kinase